MSCQQHGEIRAMVAVDSPRSKISWKRRNFGVRCRNVGFLSMGEWYFNRSSSGVSIFFFANRLWVVWHSYTISIECQQITSLSCVQQTKSEKGVWVVLCEGELLVSSERLLQSGQDVHLVQIGAHVGFEGNNPFANGISFYLNSLGADEK